MTVYNYTAYKEGSNEIVKGKVEADDMREARAAVRELGFVPTGIVEEQAVASTNAKKADGKKIAKMPRLGLSEQIDFTSTLQILAAAGIPIIESLLFIENDAAKLKIRQCATELRRQIMNGGTFAGTIAKYPEQFGQVYIGLTKAGEDSGELEKTLERLLELLNKQAAIRAKVIGTLMYPVFVICLAIFIVLVMLVFVFPVFAEMFESMGMTLPWITRVLMTMGVFLKKNWITIPLGLGGTVFLIQFLFKWKPSRWKIDEWVLKIPVLSDLMQYSNFANFIAVMQVAYEAGVPILECLYLATVTLTNHTLLMRVDEATVRVQQGQHLSSALRATRTMPKMILFMIATGEQSGRLGDMLLQATNYIDKKLDTIIDIMTKMIEPIMLIVIGTIVLILALALYLPLFASYMGM
ncbi:type II secretion system F family protein [bacterium]|nr:type II secretion system F family protein [bacterium]